MTSIANRGRPAGEVRQAICSTLQQHGPLPLCDIAVRAQVGYDACRHAISNALRADRVEIVGQTKVAHAKQWVALYDVVAESEPAQVVPPSVMLLDDAMRRWF
jgi:hypothetical protein